MLTGNNNGGSYLTGSSWDNFNINKEMNEGVDILVKFCQLAHKLRMITITLLIIRHDKFSPVKFPCCTT